jgi:hypothetical protein
MDSGLGTPEVVANGLSSGLNGEEYVGAFSAELYRQTLAVPGDLPRREI